MAANQLAEPNLYELQGDGLQVTFTPAGIDGKAQLDVRRGRRTQNFRGDQIRSLQTEIGQQLTVTTDFQPDQQTKTLTLLIPIVHLPEGKTRQAMSTKAILTTTKTSLGGPQLVRGVVQTYQTATLRGSAKRVEFLTATKTSAAT